VSSPRFGVIYSRLHDVIAPASFARAAESIGYDSVWATEGLVNQEAALDPVIVMAELARGSERLSVGSCVIISPLRNPAILAKQIASLDVLSAGRIVVGVGVGGSSLSNPADYRVSGVDPSERGARCSEGIEIMTKLWSGGRASHAGRFYRFEDIEMRPAPARKPPVWAGGNADGVLKRAARLCDGFVPIGPGAREYARLWERLCAYAEEGHRDRGAVTRAVHLYYCLGASRDEARTNAERTLAGRYGIEVELPRDERFLFGTLDDCLRTIESYVEAGVEHFVVNTVRPLPEVVGHIERLGRAIAGRFR